MKQVLDYEQVKHLQELGYDVAYKEDTPLAFVEIEGESAELTVGRIFRQDFPATLLRPITIGDLIEAIQKYGKLDIDNGVYVKTTIDYKLFVDIKKCCDHSELIDNLYDCLCWCLENLKGGNHE